MSFNHLSKHAYHCAGSPTQHIAGGKILTKLVLTKTRCSKTIANGHHPWWARKGIISPSNICSLPSFGFNPFPFVAPLGGWGGCRSKIEQEGGETIFLFAAQIKAGKKAEWSSWRDLGCCFSPLAAAAQALAKPPADNRDQILEVGYSLSS